MIQQVYCLNCLEPISKMLGDMTPLDLLQWYNRHVGRAYLEQANYEPCIHILDCTDLEVNIDNENYWCNPGS